MENFVKGEKQELVAQGFALFPEMFSNSRNKYERFTLWLVANHGVISSSMRDPFSAGGQAELEIMEVTIKICHRNIVSFFL